MEVTKNKVDQNKSKETGKAEIDPAIIEELNEGLPAARGDYG
jgi:hypothetical protein